jgi:RNA polymerase primary sigma factor
MVRPASDDLTRRYLDEIGQIPRLSSDDELSLARRLVRLRRRQRRHMFAAPFVMRLALESLREVRQGTLDLRQVFELPAKRGTAARLRRHLPALVRKLRCYLSRNERDFRIVLGRSRSAPVRRAAARRLSRRRRVLLRCLGRLPWRLVYMQRALRDYGQLASRLSRLQTEVRRQSAGPAAAARGRRSGREYRAELVRAQEGIRGVKRRLANLTRIDAERERVRWTLVQANLRLVVAIAKGYQRCGPGLLDLVQDGNAGILRAADKFDPTRGVGFGTYAGWWIRSSIRRNLPAQAAVICIPEKGWIALGKLRESSGELWHIYRRAPRADELASRMGMAVEGTTRLMALDAPPLSLDLATIWQDDDLSEQFCDDSAESPQTAVDRKSLTLRVERILAVLEPRERKIIELRFGLHDGHRRKLAEVGKILDVSAEWIRRLEATALGKLRQPECRAQLAGFLAE